MKANDVRKILGHPIHRGVSLRDQSTPEQWAEICFWSAVETEVISEQHKTDRKGTDAQIEKRVRSRYESILDECEGDFQKALNYFP